MQAKATALIQILHGALIELDRNADLYATDITSRDLRHSLLLAIDELELVRTGSHELQAA